MPLLPASLIEPLWVEFAALIGLDERPEFAPSHPWGCHRRRVPDRVVFDHVIAALVHGSGYERLATPSCSDRTIRRRLRDWAPVEVGEALVAYLRRGRCPDGARHLFLTCRAPRGPIRADLVGDVVERACARAGLPAVGPHRLGHTLAGELLRRGAGLVAISQVLRHRDLATAALYAVEVEVRSTSTRCAKSPSPGRE